MLTASALGYAEALAGRVAEALPLLERVREEAERVGCLAAQALSVTWRSEAYLLAGRREEVRASAPRALALADELGMRPLAAHCLRGLGTLYATTDQREQARAELSTAVAMYCAMAMAFWLPQAAVALAHGEERYRQGWCLVQRKTV
jgi:hypothetical protein